jgi:TolA-binding protein
MKNKIQGKAIGVMRKKFLTASIVVLSALFALASVHAQERLSGEAEFGFGEELFLDANFRVAEDIFKSIIISGPGAALAGDATFMEAEARYNSGRYAMALTSYIGIIEKYPGTKNKYKKELYYRIAECYYQLQDPENSVKYLKILTASYPGSYLDRDAYLLLGEDQLLAGKYDAAIDALNRLENYTDYAHFDYVYYLLGRIYYEKAAAAQNEGDRQANAKEAIKYFDRIRNEFPESGLLNHAQFRKANVYYAIGQYKKAIDTAARLLDSEKDPKFRLLITYFLAWNYYMTGDYNRAIAQYDSIIAAAKDDILSIWAEYKKGMCFEASGGSDKALAQYKLVTDKYPSTIPAAYAAYAAAYYYYNKKDYNESLARYEKLNAGYDVEELNRAAYFMIAEIYTALNELDRAVEVYGKIQEKYPDEALRARYLMGWCYYRQGDFARSTQMYELVRGDAAAPGELKGKSALKIGDNMYEAENLTGADAKYDEIVRDYGGYPDILAEAYYAKGWVDYRKNDYKAAREMFGRSKNSAKSPGIKLRSDFMIANTDYSDHDFDRALAIYSAIMQNQAAGQDMKEDSLFYSGWCQYRKANFDAAITLWERYGQSVTDPVKQAEAYYRIGWCYFRKNDFDSAAAKFAVILDKYKGTHFYQEALLKSGDSYYNKKDYNKAIEFYKEIVEKFPQHYRVGEALYGIQWSYYQLGEDDKAIELSRQFVDKYPESSFTPDIQYRVAEHYYNTGKYETAVSEFGKFLDKYPGHELADNAYYWTGISLFNLKKYGEAIAAFGTLNSKFPQNPFADKAVFKTGTAYYKLREYAKAAGYFTSFTEKYRGSQLMADAYFNLAMSYKRMDKIEDAKAWYIKLAAEFPSSGLAERAQMNMGYLLQDNKQYDEAVTWFKKVVDAGGKKAVEAQFWIGDCLNSNKDYDAAAEEYLKVYTNFKTDELWAVSALDSAGKIYEKQGKLKSAISAYEKILKTTSNVKYTDTAKKRIELLREQYRILNPAGPQKAKGGVK